MTASAVEPIDLSNPIVNSPYEPPEWHFEIGPHGPSGKLLKGRRRSESYIPVPPSRKGRKPEAVQEAFEFDITGERREVNSLINDIRLAVERWRANNWNGVTPYSRKLLEHWAPGPHRDDPVLYCQREAVETAIFLAEVAGRYGTPDFRRRLEPENRMHNAGLPRVALKMATGSGKTVVMAMLIAWQTINKVMTPRDARFAKRFLIVAPGITIRDRLGVLLPERDDNYYAVRDLVPRDLWEIVLQARIHIVNYHTFLPRDAKEIQGVSSNTRKLLRGDKKVGDVDAFRETPDMVAERVLRELGAAEGGLVVLNDEAHHCYQDKLLEHPDDAAEKEDKDRNQEARVWFRGVLDIARKANIKSIYDLSATPYYLKGSGYNEGHIFPWVVSDFSLMDAIESGIVKIPRIPVDDDAAGQQPVYLNLWDNIQPPLPKRRTTKGTDAAQGWVMPATLEGALRSLYRSYEQNHQRYEETLAGQGEPPPVLIVVCPNTVVSKLVFDWIAGREVEGSDGTTRLADGNLKLLKNVEDGVWTTRQRTILVDSVALESGEPLGADFRKDAAREIEAFKQAYRLRNPGADVEKLNDTDLLREAMNTIGKKGKLGENIRCVVSVAMLTEGWDANTVTHILGVRPFRSQLLCEQVVGRGLRRRNYAVNQETGRFDPEYAEVYGVPFAFIPDDNRSIAKPAPTRPAVEVYAVPDRFDLAIKFPKLEGYRVELPEGPIYADFSAESRLHLAQDTVALWVDNRGVVGDSEEIDLDDLRTAREQQVAYALAKRLMQDERFLADRAGYAPPWQFRPVVEICREWLRDHVTTEAGVPKGYLLLAQAGATAAEKIYDAIVRQPENRTPILMPVLRRFGSEGSTDNVRFVTRKAVMSPPPTKSHLSEVVLDGQRGNSWEEGLAEILEHDKRVHSYVKNERLDFTIPYVHQGRSHDYVPDFLVRLVRLEDDVERTLIVEVSGGQKSPGPTAAKAETARNQWCVAVNNQGGYGRWGYIEVHHPMQFREMLHDAIENLYADRPIIGDPA
jgi:type III restriction enzyme